MQKINSVKSLSTAIFQLETQQENRLMLLKEQFHSAQAVLKPVNLIKSILPGNIKTSLLKGVVGFSAGYAVKGIIDKATKRPVKNTISSMVFLTIAKLAFKNSKILKALTSHNEPNNNPSVR